MGVLVDPVRLAVLPVLEELDRRPRVVDLVEVHPHGLAEAERPQEERRDDEDDEEPQVDAAETAAALAGERAGPVEGGALLRAGRVGWVKCRRGGRRGVPAP